MKTLKKVVIAPDSFKESLSALEVADAIECGFSQIFPQVRYIKLPMADGGEGTVESMVAATDGEIIELDVTGPLGRPVQAFYGLLGDGETAVIEMAAASGLHLVPNGQRDPRITTSYGTGELMLAALAQLAHIDLVGLDPRLRQLSITAACDVDNPLCGEKGASAVFGPQKGTTPQMVAQLDAALRHYGELMEQVTGREIVRQPGTGAAGGMGAALLGMLEARRRPGIEIVIETLRLEEAVRGADLVITGEGRLDSQSIHGKTPIGVARVAKRHGLPVIGIAGSLAPDYQVVHLHGIDAAFSVLDRIVTLEEALAGAAHNLEVTARNVAAVWRLAQG